MNKEKAKISRPKKSYIERKDCLDKELKDKTKLVPQLPQKKPIMKDYEKRIHVEKIKRKPITYISQPDNAFNFQPPQKEKNQKRMITEPVPSNYYQKIEDSKNSYNHLINGKPPKKYECDAIKDNLNDVFGNNMNYKEKIRRKVNFKDTEVNQIFEKGKNNLPVGYRELTPTPGRVDFNQLSEFAKNNYDNLKKNGRKTLKKDF